jgi:sigma54-dependent transcription regulator
MEGTLRLAREILGGILERILERMAYATKREQALVLELAQVKDQLDDATIRAEAATARGDAAMSVAKERLALLTASATVAEERLGLLTAAATRAESAEKELGLARRQHDLAAKNTVRLEVRLQALKRRRERLQAELCKLQDQLARADVSGRIRELQEENAQLQQRLADLQTYVAFRVEPPHAAANGADEKQGSANPR